MTPRSGLLRALCLVLAAAGAAWAVAAFRALPDLGAIEAAGERIGRGETFRPDALRALADRAAAAGRDTCDPRLLTAALVVAVRAAEIEVAAGALAAIDPRLDSVETGARRLVACAPNASFGWLALFWGGLRRQGFGPDLVPWLAESYRTGPREAWIQARRIPLIAGIVSALPPELQAWWRADFADLVTAGRVEEAAAIAAGLGEATRARLLAGLDAVPVTPRAALARALARRGVETALPGLPPPH